MRQKADWMALLERVGLSDSADKRVSDYSKGMKMRLAFVRALAHNPDLLFLDEPTGGLDPASARTMKNIIKEQKEQGKSIILTTHNMTDAAELCDRVAFIVDGQIEALDSPKSLQTQIPETNVDFTYRDNGTTSTKQAAIAELGKNKIFMATLRDGTLLSIHSREKTLEDVFIELTGRALQ
jgi:fluoroquinolone transport system ATP-binding protein